MRHWISRDDCVWEFTWPLCRFSLEAIIVARSSVNSTLSTREALSTDISRYWHDDRDSNAWVDILVSILQVVASGPPMYSVPQTPN